MSELKASATRSYDFAVVGGGIVGSAIAYGLTARGQSVVVLDEGDRAFRAARANFGLVWMQTKGSGLPPYVPWTRRSVDAWPEFVRTLQEFTGVQIDFQKPGGLIYCLSDAELESRRKDIAHLEAQAEGCDTLLLDRAELQRLMPDARLGNSVVGASYCPHDGHCNPLFLLRALHTAMARNGAHYVAGAGVTAVRPIGGSYEVVTSNGKVEAAKVILAAGHGNASLAPSLGLTCPIRAERGQILVTERLDALLPMPASGLRQTANGTVMIGVSKDDLGLDDGTSVSAGARMAARALRIVPDLGRARLVRTWGGVRILTPDRGPIYDESESFPGVFIATCHSGITLSAVHASDLADSFIAGRLDARLNPFSAKRFDVH